MRHLGIISICLSLSFFGLSSATLQAEDLSDEYPDDFFEPMNDPVPEPTPPTPSGPPMLGIQMTPPPTHAQEVNGTTPDQGVYVRRVFPNTAASDMGLQPGDIILSINGTEIDSMTTLRDVVNQSSVGDDVNVLVTRNGEVTNYEGEFREWLDSVPKRRLDDQAEQRYRDMQKRRLDRRMANAEDRQDNLNKQLEAHKKASAQLADVPDWDTLDIDSYMMKELGVLPDYTLPPITLSGAAFSFHWDMDVDSTTLQASDKETPETDADPRLLLLAAAVPDLHMHYAFNIDANEL